MLMINKQKILEIKATLFDFQELFTQNDKQIKEMMQYSYEKIKHVLQADDASIYMDKQRLARIAPNGHPEKLKEFISTNASTLGSFAKQFKDQKSKVLINRSPITLNDKTYPYHVIMRLEEAANFQGYYVFTFEQDLEIEHKTMEEIQQIIDQHFKILCDNFYEKVIRKRNQTLFQLSANLHSVYNTIDVLKRVYRSVKLLYPYFEYRFLMSHEYDDTTMPIYTIEYYDNNEFLGTKAFMNNKMQIDLKLEENKTIIYTPLTGRQGVYGIFEVTIPMLINLTKADIDFIKQSSKMIGRAVERTTLYQSSTQLVTDLQHINLASRDLNRNLEKSEISESVKKHIVDSCQAEEIGIVFLPNGEETNKPFSITEESTSYFKLPQADEFVHYLLERLHKDTESILSGNFKVEGMSIPFNSVMVIPMLDSERMFGFIVLAHEKPYYFSFDKYKFVQSFVQHAALAYANSILKEKLRETAITDYLTNLYMRNYLDKQIDRFMTEDDGGSFMLLDVDDFKLVNDTYGHYVGDKVLIQIADVLRETVNNNEIAARWGGEEFAVYLPYCDEMYAEEIANRIRHAIQEQTDPKVTVSIGISSWCDSHHSIEELFIQADEALYKAKETGKNRIVIN